MGYLELVQLLQAPQVDDSHGQRKGWQGSRHERLVSDTEAGKDQPCPALSAADFGASTAVRSTRTRRGEAKRRTASWQRREATTGFVAVQWRVHGLYDFSAG